MLGFFGGLVFCLIGLFIAIPTGGLFGVFWTLIAVAITVTHGLNAFTNKTIATHEIMIDDVGERGSVSGTNPKKRLQELQDLYDKGLITAEEYHAKRKRIIDSI
ncbi:MAG: SHOCT domain-containing protein [Firmicutes bacterium]|nr:SHOCT domain-containing protein [Bacillota bacterium]